jgi:ATP-binding cassette subfamily B protein
MTTRSEFVVKHAWTSSRRGPVRWVFSHAIRNKLIILMVLIGAFGNAALAAAVPIYIGQGFDAILQDNPNLNALLWACIWLVVSQVVRSILQLGRNFGSEVLGQSVERDTRQELYGALLGKSMRFHDSYPSGEMMARATNDVRELALMFAPGVNLVIGSANFLIMPLLIAPSYHPALILTPALFLIAYIFALRHYLGQLNPVTAEVRRSFGQLNATLTQAIEGIETVKGAAQEEAEVTRFEKNAVAVRNAFVEQGKVEANFLPLLLMGLANGFALWHAIVLYRADLISVGDVVAYMGLIALFGFPVFVSIFAYSQVSSGVSSARRILSVIESETELDQNAGGYSAPMRGAIRFENVTFRYRTERADGLLPTSDTLSNISFAIEPGQTLAVVGQTGAGKSTIAKLINRTYDIDQGKLLIDGVDVREWDLASLRQQISIIEQDIFLFSRTIAENITFGSPDASPEAMQQAAQAAQADHFIEQLSNGYQTVVGERGVMLSGGQRQRIALARAFLVHPSILILDDSTSAIDSATEDQIQQAIEAASEGRSTILITHRLSQIRRADKILVLKQGRVAAIGTHDQLLQQSEAYRNIFARG